MCTAISYLSSDHYFGRNLDLEYSNNESVIITPQMYKFSFRNGMQICSHYALIGIGMVEENYPLYYEAVNEKGLCIAGLNFPGNAAYYPASCSKDNIASFELIPYLLSQCANIDEAEHLLKNISIWDEPFNRSFPTSPLHWLLSDKNRSLVIEQTADGLNLYPNPVGVLTNNPPFPYHLHNLTNYMQLTDRPPANRQTIELIPYSLGLGSFGLPGDMSSGSRFVKAAITKMHSLDDGTDTDSVIQFFHILGAAAQQRGMTQLENSKHEYTQYTSCCNASKGVYYYTTYKNSRISAVDMGKENLDSDQLICYPLKTDPDILLLN